MEINHLVLDLDSLLTCCVVSVDEVHSGDSGPATRAPAQPRMQDLLLFPQSLLLHYQSLENQGTGHFTTDPTGLMYNLHF